MPPSTPTLEQWRRLYDLALELRKLEPWTRLDESQVFGVQDPATGVVGYCTVLGALGTHFALNVYPGVDGLSSLMALAMSRDDEEAFGAMVRQDCVAVSFESKKGIDKEDKHREAGLGLKLRGSSAHPLFRSSKPFLAPWRLTDEEARFMEVALEQSLHLLRRAIAGELEIPVAPAATLPVRVPRESGDGIEWVDEWQPFPAIARPDPVEPFRVDEVTLAKLRGLKKDRNRVWEVDYRFGPRVQQPDGGEDDADAMTGMMVVGDDLGMVLTLEILLYLSIRQELPVKLVDVFLKYAYLPDTIYVERRELASLLGELGKAVGVPVMLVKSLPNIARFMQYMHSHGAPM